MKNSVILALFFFFTTTFAGMNVNANPNLTNLSSSAKAVKATEDYVYHRVLIAGIWWIFVYTTDGTFIVVYPDEDE